VDDALHIPVITINDDVGKALLAGAGQSPGALQAAIDKALARNRAPTRRASDDCIWKTPCDRADDMERGRAAAGSDPHWRPKP
jgi:hypothetical protein